jgi:hypothetical protein
MWDLENAFFFFQFTSNLVPTLVFIFTPNFSLQSSHHVPTLRDAYLKRYKEESYLLKLGF